MSIFSKISSVIIPPWVKVAIIIAIFGGYSWWWYNLGWKSRDRDALQEKVAQMEAAENDKKEIQDRLDDVSSRLQTALSNVRVETRYVDRVITKEIEKPIYTQCVLPDTGKIILNDNADRLNRLRK